MTSKSHLSLVRWIDLDASLATPCSSCRHSEFIHGESGPCLYSECKCPRFLPMVHDTQIHAD
jgi:hypothetical protein